MMLIPGWELIAVKKAIISSLVSLLSLLSLQSNEAFWTQRLCEACKSGNLAQAKKCLKQGANINGSGSRGDYKGIPPLHVAAQNTHLPLINFFLRNKNININAQDNDGGTVLHLQRLIYPEDDPNATNQATLKLATLKLFLDAGASLHALDSRKDTPLHLACGWNNSQAIKLFLSYGGVVTSKNTYNQSPHTLSQQYGEAITDQIIKIDSGDVDWLQKDNSSKDVFIKYMIARGYDKLLAKLLMSWKWDVKSGLYRCQDMNYQLQEDKVKILDHKQDKWHTSRLDELDRQTNLLISLKMLPGQATPSRRLKFNFSSSQKKDKGIKKKRRTKIKPN